MLMRPNPQETATLTEENPNRKLHFCAVNNLQRWLIEIRNFSTFSTFFFIWSTIEY